MTDAVKAPSTYRQEQARATRDRIAAAARALFAVDGYRMTSMAAIAQKAGVAERTVYTSFGAKREIQAIIRDYVDKGFGVMLISSEFEELVEGADRIVVMHEGRSIRELANPGATENALMRALAHQGEAAA